MLKHAYFIRMPVELLLINKKTNINFNRGMAAGKMK